jgi:hypothetical protein
MTPKLSPVPYKTQLLNGLGYLTRPWEKFFLDIFRRIVDLENGLDQGPDL